MQPLFNPKYFPSSLLLSFLTPSCPIQFCLFLHVWDFKTLLRLLHYSFIGFRLQNLVHAGLWFRFVVVSFPGWHSFWPQAAFMRPLQTQSVFIGWEQPTTTVSCFPPTHHTGHAPSAPLTWSPTSGCLLTRLPPSLSAGSSLVLCLFLNPFIWKCSVCLSCASSWGLTARAVRLFPSSTKSEDECPLMSSVYSHNDILILCIYVLFIKHDYCFFFSPCCYLSRVLLFSCS